MTDDDIKAIHIYLFFSIFYKNIPVVYLIFQKPCVRVEFYSKNTPIRISNWKDILKALIGALILIPLMILLKQFLQGWVLVISYVLLGVLTFCVMEYILKNGSFIWICSTVSDKFRMKTK